MNALIVGGTGFLGRHLCEKLISLGHGVRYTGRGVISDSSYIQCDITKDELVIPDGTDVVYYVSQAESYANFPGSAANIFGVNTHGAIKSAVAAQKKGCKAFLYASTGNVYAPSFLPRIEDDPLDRSYAYSLSKVQAEEVLKLMASGTMRICCFRIFGLYGSTQTTRLAAVLLNNVRQGNPISLAPTPEELDAGNTQDTGGLRLSWLCVHDAATQLVDLAQKALVGDRLPLFMNLAGPQPLSLRDFAGLMGKRLGINPIYAIPDVPRTQDLIADVRLAQRLLSPQYTSHEAAIDNFVYNFGIDRAG